VGTGTVIAMTFPISMEMTRALSRRPLEQDCQAASVCVDYPFAPVESSPLDPVRRIFRLVLASARGGRLLEVSPRGLGQQLECSTATLSNCTIALESHKDIDASPSGKGIAPSPGVRTREQPLDSMHPDYRHRCTHPYSVDSSL
jgi:hypothetical protein